MKTQGLPESPPDVDALLRRALRDDLPEAVEARLEGTLEGFLTLRRRVRPDETHLGRLWEWLAAMPDTRRRGLAAVPASLLFACGLVWHAAAGPPALAESLTQAHVTVSLADAIRAASSMSCTDDVMERFRSPADFAGRVYGAWVQQGTAHLRGALHVGFFDPDEGATYELTVNPDTMLPYEVRRIVRTGPGALSAPASATCTWVVGPPGRGRL